jgi:UDP-N-acetylglucosamine:LPS N-acetylglucosamine transferase
VNDQTPLSATIPAVPAASGSDPSGMPVRPGDGRGGIMLVGSSGGHLAQLLALRPWWADKVRHWVTFQTPDAQSLLDDEPVTWAHYPTTRNLPNLLRNFVLAVRLVLRKRPDAILSTGAGVALPFFVMGRLLGIPTVYIEVYDRIDSRTLTARLCRPFTSSLLVQWEEQRRLYPHAIVVGALL